MSESAFTGATNRLAAFALAPRELPDALTLLAKRHMLDTFACMLSGARTPAVQAASRLHASLVAQAGSALAIPGLGTVGDDATAALLTGLAAHADDFDDTSEYSMRGHPSAPVLSGLLPVVQNRHSSGQALIEAYAIGVEIACKLGRLLGETHTLRGWHTMSTIGTVATTIACARLSGLGLDATCRAVGIAASMAGGLVGNFGTYSKALHCGLAARNAYDAMTLGRLGFEAQPDIIERADGFVAVFGDHATARWSALDGLGRPWDLLDPGIAIKVYPSCSCTHLAIDGMLDLLAANIFVADDVRRVRCYVREECLRYLVCHDPKTPIEAKFSIEYCIACALVRRHVTPDDFTVAAIADPALRAFFLRVELLLRPEGGTEPDIELELQDGRVFARRYEDPRGSLRNPLSWDDLVAKFRDCAGSRLSPATVEGLLRDLAALETLDDVGPLLDAMAGEHIRQ